MLNRYVLNNAARVGLLLCYIGLPLSRKKYLHRRCTAFLPPRALVSEKRAEMARTLALRAEGDMAGAMSLVKGKTGVALMDGIRHLVGQMDAEQDLLVAGRQAAVREIGLVTAISTAVSLVLMGLVALAALNEVRRRTRLAGFMPVEVASRLADGDSDLRHGRTGPATVAFVDLRGSTARPTACCPRPCLPC